MDTSNPEAVEAVSSHKALPPIKRQRRSPELKRQIVEETLAPGASVARVARAHGVNANLDPGAQVAFPEIATYCGIPGVEAQPIGSHDLS